jgi:ABC-type dipeptide/oligopeptide/nickel transport system permease subunit
MAAQLPEADAQVPSLALAPAGAEFVAPRRGWLRSLDVVVPAAMLAFLLFLFFVWPLFGTVGKPTGGNILDANIDPFSSAHLFGTDPVGNDIWSRILYGGRNSIEIALAVQLIGLIIGGSVGAFAGYWGSLLNSLLMRVLDVLIAFPALVLALAIAENLGRARPTPSWRFRSSACRPSHGSRGRPPCGCASGRSSSRRGCREPATLACCCATSRPTSCPSS